MGNADAGFAPGNILFMIFEYIYIALIVMCFVLYLPLYVFSHPQVNGKSSARFKVFVYGDGNFLCASHVLHAVLLSVVDH